MQGRVALRILVENVCWSPSEQISENQSLSCELQETDCRINKRRGWHQDLAERSTKLSRIEKIQASIFCPRDWKGGGISQSPEIKMTLGINVPDAKPWSLLDLGNSSYIMYQFYLFSLSLSWQIEDHRLCKSSFAAPDTKTRRLAYESSSLGFHH